MIAFIFLLSIFIPAPLLDRADPSFSPNPVKAPWYFSGIQELLMHFHPTVAVFIIPLLAGCWLFAFPYFKPGEKQPGTWFYTPKGIKITIFSAVVSFILTVIAILVGEYLVDFQEIIPNLPEFVSNGLIPLTIWMILLGGIGYFVKKKFKASLTEMHLWIFTFLVVAYLVLMFTAVFFRGEAMALTIGL
jgi:hypothetical protein